MSKHRSFVPSDFSLRDVPIFLVAYVTMSAVCVFAGLAIQALPPWWGGMLCGLGLGFCAAIMLRRDKPMITRDGTSR
jgi:4-hydroxybenzoate polyprenyltransferase